MFGPETENKVLGSDDAYHISKLSFGGIELLMPQNEILSIESVYELDSNIKDGKHIGEIYKQGYKLQVYCFSDSMEILKKLPKDRIKCVVIRHSHSGFAILCNDINNIILSDISIQNIPICMNSDLMPFSHLCLYKEDDHISKLGLVTNAICLNKYIDQKN